MVVLEDPCRLHTHRPLFQPHRWLDCEAEMLVELFEKTQVKGFNEA